MKLRILSQARMIRGECWLLPILYMQLMHFFRISMKYPTSTYKNFYLAIRSRAIWSYKGDVPIFQENLHFLHFCRVQYAILRII